MSDSEHAPSAAGSTPQTPSGWRRAGHLIGALLVGVVLPALLVGWLIGQFGVAAMISGLLLGIVGAKIGGYRRMLYLSPGMGVAAGVAAFTAYDWTWVALLTLLGVITGAAIRFGWLPPTLMIPIAATFVTPVSTVVDAVIYGLILALGTLYGVAIARRFGAAAAVDGDRQSLPVATGVAIVFGAVLGGGAAIGTALGWTEPYWVADPILICVLYTIIGKRDRIRGKAIGTALGAAAAIPVAILSPPAQVLHVVGIVAFLVFVILNFRDPQKYWLRYVFLTFAIILLLAAPGQVAYETEERGVQVLVGLGLLVIGLIIISRLAGFLAKRYPQPEPLIPA